MCSKDNLWAFVFGSSTGQIWVLSQLSVCSHPPNAYSPAISRFPCKYPNSEVLPSSWTLPPVRHAALSPPLLHLFADFEGWPRFQYWDDIPRNAFSTGLTYHSTFVEGVWTTKQRLRPNPVVTLSTMCMSSYHSVSRDFGNFETLPTNTHPISTIYLFLNSTARFTK